MTLDVVAYLVIVCWLVVLALWSLLTIKDSDPHPVEEH